jgi:hypothetical protein
MRVSKASARRPKSTRARGKTKKKCAHGKQKVYCKACGGSAFCEHGTRKVRCKACGGSAFCEHGKQKPQCQECGGSAFCAHGKRKVHCQECGGSAFCAHGKQKARCKECGGSDLCVHGKRKPQCKECGGSAFCEHGRRKERCQECGGSAFCAHGKRKTNCAECNNFSCSFCDGAKFSSATTMLGHMRSFHGDEPRARTKQRELAVHTALRAAGIQFDYQFHVPFRGCGLAAETQCAYVDFLVPMPWGYVVVEVDEEQHAHYPASCDVRRDFDVAASVAMGSDQKLVVLRYNPDAYKVAGETVRTPTKERLGRLVSAIRDMTEPEGFQRVFLFYDKDAASATLPSVSKEWTHLVVRALSKCL